MNISYRWLCGLVPGLHPGAQEIADRLALLGAPVDEVIDLGTPLRDIVVARVIEARQHPNADRLSLCTVDAGTATQLQVVCGAPNVRAGSFYPFAPVGATLPGGMNIRRAKIRGEESQGMLCSARELGLGRDHEGILELAGELQPGTSFIESVALDDFRLVVDITPNRPDLLSHVGVAREIAAAYGLRTHLAALPGASEVPSLRLEYDQTETGNRSAHVTIDDPALCPRYFGLIVRGVRVSPSPEWLAGRLRVVGLRPISNVVDATNYVLHELGQPLHAFDLDRLGNTIVVRGAREGERIMTLDGIERTLTAGMPVIADAGRPVAIAGVMGGSETEVDAETRDILVECALFDAAAVRTTRRVLNLSTDASFRFERGVDPDGMLPALQRVAELIVAVAGGTVEPAVIAAGHGPAAQLPIRLRLKRVEQVLGTSFTTPRVTSYLEPLGFVVQSDGNAELVVDVPGHRRNDVTAEIDLIEELARRHGYDAFAEELRPFRPSAVPDHPLFALEERVRALLVGRGLREAHTAAFAPDSEGSVSLMLPLAATEGRLRASLLPGLVRRVEYNFARGARTVRLFELGTTFEPGRDALPIETTRLAIAVTGLRQPPHWSEPEAIFDSWDLKGLAEEVARLLGCVLEPGADGALLEPGLSFRLLSRDNGEQRGIAGQVATDRVDAPAWADDVWVLEVELRGGAQVNVKAAPLPQYPPVERDLALLVPDATPAAAVTQTVRTAGGPLLEEVAPFDVYSGSGMQPGVRSIAFRLRFRATDRTLRDEEVDDVVRRVLQRLSDDLGIQQRT